MVVDLEDKDELELVNISSGKSISTNSSKADILLVVII